MSGLHQLFGMSDPDVPNPPIANQELELPYSAVFIAGGFPRYTYNPRLGFKMEDSVSQVLRNLCQLVTVTGSTKSGKTTLVEKILPRTKAVWIDGGSIGREEDFWTSILEQRQLFESITKENSKESSSELSGKLSGEARLFVASGGGEVASKLSSGTGEATSASRTLSPKIVALSDLSKRPIPVVIDDFHYLSKPIQESIIHALKSHIYQGLPVVLIAIPHHRYDAIKVEREMTGRIVPVTIPPWSEEELGYISDTGFKLLNSTINSDLKKRLTSESIGSPHLMQAFCRKICEAKKIYSSKAGHQIILTDQEITEIFSEIADSIGRPIFDKLARGPRQRSDRIPRTLKNKKSVDIYGLVLLALAHIKPGVVSLEYEQLRLAIKDILADQPPTIQEVARVLKHMSEIAATDRSSTPVIEFDNEEKLLHITDPFFAFYLKWGNFS